MRGLEQGFTIRNMVDVPLGPGPLQDGLDKVVVDSLHNLPGIGLMVLVHGNVQDPHTLTSSVLLVLVKGVAEFGQLVSLLRHCHFKRLLLLSNSNQRDFQEFKFLDQSS